MTQECPYIATPIFYRIGIKNTNGFFTTWRLGDALPWVKLQSLRKEKECWLRQHPEPWDPETEKIYHMLFSQQVDQWLDQGMGSCILRKEHAGKTLARILLNDHQTRVDLECFVVMPNHVHALFRSIVDVELCKLIRCWKGVSSREINKTEKRTGPLWQEGYWDRLIRNTKHWEKTRRYILENPGKAKLKKGFVLYDHGTLTQKI